LRDVLGAVSVLLAAAVFLVTQAPMLTLLLARLAAR
jgi:hypothetical protein